MIRVLVLIAVSGFLVAVVSLSSAIAIGGPEAIARGAWSMGPHTHWGWRSHDDDDDDDRHGRRTEVFGPETSRELAWPGGDTLAIEVPADVQFTQAPGAGKLVVTGPEPSVRQVVVEDGRIRFDRRGRRAGRLTIVMSAPDVTHFAVRGANRLTIDGYRQDQLEIDLSGDSEVVAKGTAKVVDLDISGSGEADLSGLPSAGADVDVSGSGEAIVAPSDWATLDISGSGEVNLLTNPPRLETDISGSGRIRQDARPAAPSSAPMPGQKL